MLYAPSSGQPSVDIVFIHGLGGTSLRTWCKNRDLDFLWPRDWLPQEPGLENARILTFGYHANFAKKEQVSLAIADFANDLLFRLKYDGSNLGNVPIVVVAHSLGGLVFKKARMYQPTEFQYHGLANCKHVVIQGSLKEKYKDIASRIKAVLFLGTPHHGTDLAETLNRVLKSSFFGHSQKEYVNELSRNSSTIEEMHELFRHHSRNLQIFSFYETVATSVGPLTMMIVDKASSVLGYDNEVHEALIANHHDVCKFSSPQESNYRAICGALKSIVANIKPDTTGAGDNMEESELGVLRSWLGVTGPPEEDLALLQAVRRDGTCEDFSRAKEFTKWAELEKPCVLWAHAPPGSGKSVHCSFVIDKLVEERSKVAYWFFKYEDAGKRSLGNMLRSVAYQIASTTPGFRRELVDLAKAGSQVIRAEATVVWRTIFEPKLRLIDKPYYLVVDGLDESESAKTFIDIISKIGRVNSGLRAVIFSRPLSPISHFFRRAKKMVPVFELPLSNNLVDIRLVATDEMEYFVSDDENFKAEIIDEIASRSQGSFLWATLVLNQIVDCLRHEDVRKALNDAPDGMDRLYDRMAESIAMLGSTDKELSRILLSWAIYSQRPVTVHELKGPYETQLHTIIDLKHTIDQVCGQFASLGQNEHIVLVHQTARDYLKTTDRLPFSLGPEGAHSEMLCLCLQSLCDTSLRGKIRQRKTLPFIDYASSCWAFHLEQCSVESDAVLDVLCQFFSGIYPMVLIQLLSTTGNLPLLVSASSSISRYASARRKADAVKSPTSRRDEDLALLERWATDFVKIPAKFGRHLADDPESIFNCIPALCPQNSAISWVYSDKTANAISITGITRVDWDDCSATVAAVLGKALHVAVSSQYLAVANDSRSGCIQLWETVVFQEYRMLAAEESIHAITFSHTGSLIACCGLYTTYVWKVSDGTLVAKVLNPPEEDWEVRGGISFGKVQDPTRRQRAISLGFASHERSIIIATNLRGVYHLALDKTPAKWSEFDPALIGGDSFQSPSPTLVSFNPNCSHLAVAFKDMPLEVWELDPPKLIARCRLPYTQSQRTNNTWSEVKRAVWHPFTGHVLGIYLNGKVFKWGPMDDSHEEAKQQLDGTPSEIECSGNGHVFATVAWPGLVGIYDNKKMTLIYKLTSKTHFTAVAFSPDGGRLYDIRGASCNMWEPDCLVQPVSQSLNGPEEWEDITSSVGNWGSEKSITSGTNDVGCPHPLMAASGAHAERRAPITAVFTCRKSQKLAAYSKDKGTLVVKDLTRDRGYQVAEGVEHAVLSHDGKRLAYHSMLNSVIAVQDLDFESEDPCQGTRLIHPMNYTYPGMVRNLVFHANGNLLLVAGSFEVLILSVANGEAIARLDFIDFHGKHRIWSIHPGDAERLLAFGNKGVRVYSWQNLQQLDVPGVGHENHDVDNPSEISGIESLQQCFHSRMCLAISSTWDKGLRRFNFIIYQQAEEGLQSGRDTFTEMSIPAGLYQKVMHPVGILQDGRLVFLDHHLWICTLPLDPIESHTAPIRHFFIPRDWVDRDEIMLFSMLRDGTILFPSRGELGVIRNGIEAGW